MPDQEAKVFLDVKISGDTSFTLTHFRGIEGLSQPFEYHLKLASSNRNISFDAMMGTTAVVSVKSGDKTRTFTGIIGQFEEDETPFEPLDYLTNYHAVVYPSFWLLKFSGQCRIFQKEAAITIIQFVLGEQHKIPFENRVQKAGQKSRDFCVQYNETDFNFLSRLMEEEGIFYFFEQTEAGYKLVLADSPAAHAPCPNAATASFHNKGVETPFLETVTTCFLKQRLGTTTRTLDSYNYLTPSTPLSATASGKTTPAKESITLYDEIYDEKSQGETLVRVQLEESEFPKKIVEGTSVNPFFLPGYRFTLKEHPRKDVNISYTLLEVIHEAHRTPGKGEPLYNNTFKAFSSTIPFKAPPVTPKPRIYGTQTAKVTGKEGEEIYTDDYGRIKVKFHWDPSKKNDDTTSCWIRVSEDCSGKGWGTLFTPRVGMEVVVSFIDGDPDKPLVIGVVYNGDNKPPYLPQNKEVWTIKDQSSPKGTGFNEIRLKSKKGEEEVYVHAEKEYNIEVKEGNSSLKILKGNYLVELGEGNITITCKTGNVDMNCAGKLSITAQQIDMKASTSITLNAATSFKVEAGGTVEINSGGSSKLSAGGVASVSGSLVRLN